MKLFKALSFALALGLPGLVHAQAADDAIYYGRAMTLASQLHLSDVSLHRHTNSKATVRGTLPDGKTIEFQLTKAGEVDRIDSLSTFGFRPNSVGSYIPASVLAHPSLPRGAMIRKVDYKGDSRLELDGWDYTTRSFLAEFSSDGQLIFINWEE
jgi:hypothetical protein